MVLNLIILIPINIFVFLEYKNLFINAIEGPYDFQIASIRELYNITGNEDFDVSQLDERYYNVLWEGKGYSATAVMSPWQWGTESEFSGFKADYDFVFLFITDLGTGETFTQHARIKPEDVETFWADSTESFEVTINELPQEEYDAIYQSGKVIPDIDKDEYSEEAQELFSFAQEVYDGGYIREDIVFDINFKNPRGSLFIYLGVFAAQFLILVYQFMKALSLLLYPAEKRIGKYLHPDELERLGKQFERIKYKIEEKSKLYLTDDYLFDGNRVELIPIKRISFIRTVLGYRDTDISPFLPIAILNLLSFAIGNSRTKFLEVQFVDLKGKSVNRKYPLKEYSIANSISDEVYRVLGKDKEETLQ